MNANSVTENPPMTTIYGNVLPWQSAKFNFDDNLRRVIRVGLSTYTMLVCRAFNDAPHHFSTTSLVLFSFWLIPCMLYHNWNLSKWSTSSAFRMLITTKNVIFLWRFGRHFVFMLRLNGVTYLLRQYASWSLACMLSGFVATMKTRLQCDVLSPEGISLSW